MDVNIPSHRSQHYPHSLHLWQGLVSCIALVGTSLNKGSVPNLVQPSQHGTSRGCVSFRLRGFTGNTSEVHILPYSLQASQCLVNTQLHSILSLPRVPEVCAVLCCALMPRICTHRVCHSASLPLNACSFLTPPMHPLHRHQQHTSAAATAHVQCPEAHQHLEGQQQW